MARPSAGGNIAFVLAALCTLLVVYASLHPLAGWHDSGAPLTAFVTAGWPRYTIWFDLAVNVAGYLPLGFLWVPANMTRLRAGPAVVVATVLGAGLSLGLETAQNFLPSRVPSNVDWACNSLGTLVGALLGARWGRTLLDGGRLHAWRSAWVADGPAGDFGLMLAVLWLFTQCDPATLLFANGDLRSLLGLAVGLPYSATGFARVEAALVAAHTLALGLLLQGLFRRRAFLPAVAVVAAGLAAKSLVLALAMGAGHALAWATPGSLAGFATGLVAWAACAWLPGGLRRALAAMALLAATALVNLAPENPYLVNALQVWTPGYFFNFHGVTSLAATVWPFLALAWLVRPQGRMHELQ